MGEIAEALRRASREVSENAPRARPARSRAAPKSRSASKARTSRTRTASSAKGALTESTAAVRVPPPGAVRVEPPEASELPEESREAGFPETPVAQGGALETLRPRDTAVVLEESSQLERCRHLALRVRAELDVRGARSVALTSSMRDEGKTTVVCNLALALSTISAGRSVALVDLDLRKPSIAEILGISQGCGIEAVLQGEDLDRACVTVDRPEIDVYPAYEPQRAAHQLLVQPEFEQLIADLTQRYETVLVDTPPALLVPDTTLILAHVGSCLPIARMGRTRARAFRQMMELLPRDRILGEILNGNRQPRYANDHYYYQADERSPGQQGA